MQNLAPIASQVVGLLAAIVRRSAARMRLLTSSYRMQAVAAAVVAVVVRHSQVRDRSLCRCRVRSRCRLLLVVLPAFRLELAPLR